MSPIARISKIVSGGQTGVDRAAFDVALALGITCGGWCPKGRRAEDGVIDVKYPLKETPTVEWAERTEWNVRDSDGTLILAFGPLSGGTRLTAECAEKHAKPVLVIDVGKEVDRAQFEQWLQEHNIRELNIAGPRESHAPGEIYARAQLIIYALLS